MATKSQLEFIKNNSKCIELATIMANTVYPRIVELLNVLGMDEVHFENMDAFRQCCFTKNYKIQFFEIDENEDKQSDYYKHNIYEINCKGKTLCPYFSKELFDIEKFKSPSEDYLVFCNVAINSLYTLENKVFKIDKVLERARNLSMPLSRIILIEKYK